MYAMQYGALVYFSETESRLFDTDPDALIEIDELPNLDANHTVRINSETGELEIIELAPNNEPNDNETYLILRNAVNQI